MKNYQLVKYNTLLIKVLSKLIKKNMIYIYIMILEIIISSTFLVSASVVSIYAFRNIYGREVKNLQESTNDAIKLIDARLTVIYNNGDMGNDEYKKLLVMKDDLLKAVNISQTD